MVNVSHPRPRGRRAARRSAVAVVVPLLLVAGCASGRGADQSDGGTEFEASPSAGTTLRIMGFGTGDEIAQVRHDRAVEALGGADVELAEGELDPQAFLSAVAAGNPPDLVYAPRDQIGTFASRGAVRPLDECVEAQAVDTDAFIESAVEQVTFDDELYGIPEFNAVQIVMANSDLLSAAGLTLDDVDGSDRAVVEKASEALRKGDGGDLQVIGFDPKLPEFLPLWAKAAGADLISEDGRTAQLDSPEVIEALTWAVGIYDAQGGFPAVKTFRDTADFFGAGNQFATGQLGAMPMEQWYVNVLAEASPDAPLAFTTVKASEGEPLAFTGGSAWAIPVGAENPAAACRYATTMTHTDSWIAAAEARAEAREAEGLVFTGVLTGNTEADARIREELVADDVPSPWKEAIDAMYEANDHPFTLPANPADNEFETTWQDAVNRVLNGEQEPAQAMARAQQEAQAALDGAWATWDEKQDQ